MVDINPKTTIRIADLLASIDAYNLNMIKHDTYGDADASGDEDGNYFYIIYKEALEEALTGRSLDDLITIEQAAQLSYDITVKVAEKNTYYSKKKDKETSTT